MRNRCEDIKTEINSDKNETVDSCLNVDFDIYDIIIDNINSNHLGNDLLSDDYIGSDEVKSTDTPEHSNMKDCRCNINNNITDEYFITVLKRALLLMALKLRYWLSFLVTENIASLLKMSLNDSEKHITKYLLKKFLDKFSTA